MNITLVIMAAGIGSRYGAAEKQLEQVGPNGELILDYSIYDAVEAGFSKIIFVIREELEQAFRSGIGKRIPEGIEVQYAYQKLENLPEGYQGKKERKKPWGTGQAVLSCIGKIKEPFAVINADDYYGKQAFQKVANFLQKTKEEAAKPAVCMVGYRLQNTLSPFGTVTRGICEVNGKNELQRILETKEIQKKEGRLQGKQAEKIVSLHEDDMVSMNFFGFPLAFLELLEQRFCSFLDQYQNSLEAEYLIPIVVDELLQEGKIQVSVLESTDHWFGVTYQEDKQHVQQCIRKLVEKGQYDKEKRA